MSANRVATLTSHLAASKPDRDARPELVPHELQSFDKCGLLKSRWAFAHVAWMAKKNALGQDIFLIGATGTVFHIDQAVVTAAIRGREIGARLHSRVKLTFSAAMLRTASQVLILEGFEKVERNVLPVLNNLLENREMQLEDGRFLVAPKRYDELVKQGVGGAMKEMRLVKVHPKFRVIALGVPVPPFPGNPLDPPLRSRFQARHIERLPTGLLLAAINRLQSQANNGAPPPASVQERVTQLLRMYEALWQFGALQAGTSGAESSATAFMHMVYPSESSIISAATLLQAYPELSIADVVSRVFPLDSAIMDVETRDLVADIVPQHDGPAPTMGALLERMLHARKFAAAAGYKHVETLHLYQDMTARDLLLRRTTTERGETIWQTTPLSAGLKSGGLVILDGIDRLALGTISVLIRLIEDRELTLFDGTRYVEKGKLASLSKKLGKTEAEMRDRNVHAIHPGFRILALANPPERSRPWLTNEVMHLFHFFSLDGQAMDAAAIVKAEARRAKPADLSARMTGLAAELAVISADGTNSISANLSLRQMLRVARRSAAYPEETVPTLASALMLSFMPATERDVVIDAMAAAKFDVPPGFGLDGYEDGKDQLPSPEVTTLEDGSKQLRIGSVVCPVTTPKNMALVPDIVFFDIPKHLLHLEAMLKDLLLGEHLLLIGNQGVGKNKLTDKLLMLMQREREYVQLHRDTTVQALTLLPSLRQGVVVYEDSPLVKAMVNGRVLMVDEFDKAPTEVVCILKGLLEDGEVLLADGRRFVTPKSPLYAASKRGDDLPTPVWRADPGFQVIALANRPGYPFLGNDFFREMGDVFSCHVIGNPDRESEVALLRSYGPDVPLELVQRLVGAFGELRSMADSGTLSYPYSTRELVNVVRHLQKYPKDNITAVLENMFAFDAFDSELKEQLRDVFRRHGIPVGTADSDADLTELHQIAEPQKVGPAVLTHQLFAGASQPTAMVFSKSAAEIPAKKLVGAAAMAPMPVKWRPMQGVTSGRVNRFSEEVIGWPVGHVGEVIGICSMDGNVFALTDTLELYEFDLSFMSQRTLQLTRLGGSMYSWGGPIGKCVVSMPRLGLLYTYDVLNRSALIIQPFTKDGREAVVTPYRMDMHPTNPISPRPVGIFGLQEVDCVGAFAVNGRRISILSVGGPHVPTVIHVDLPESLRIHNLEVLSSGRFLLECFPAMGDKQRLASYGVGTATQRPRPRPPHEDQIQLFVCEFQTLAGIGGNYAASIQGATFFPVDSREFAKTSTGLDFWSPAISGTVLAAMPGIAPSETTNTVTSADSVGGFTLGIDRRPGTGLQAEVHRFPRTGLFASELTLNSDKTVPFLAKRRMSVWLSKAQLTATVISSPLAVVVEVFDAVSQTVRTIPLARNIDDSKAFIATPEQQQDSIFLRNSGMPHVLDATETSDGKLAILLGNGDELEAALEKFRQGAGDREVRGESSLVEDAVEMAERAVKRQQEGLELNDLDDEQYTAIYESVEREIKQLRVVLESAEAKEQERVWLKGQTIGDLDDSRLVDGATGDRNVYKRRGKDDRMFGKIQQKPKRISFVVDVSSSMSVMNSDGRLDRMCATVVMIMEAFNNMQHKYEYNVVGHSGDTDGFVFVDWGKAPTNRSGRLEVIRRIYNHSTLCGSGDNTLSAGARAVDEVTAVQGDDYFVFLLSDANLAAVNAYIIFIANELEAEDMRRMMPIGRAHVVLDTQTLPKLFRQIFSAAVI
eukprot:gene4263-23013_t